MLPYSRQLIDRDDIESVVAALNSSHLTQGPLVERFEKDLASYLGVKYALVFNSATSALYTAYRAYGIGKGDEALTTPLSFCATSNMLLMLEALPRFIDVKIDGNIDENLLEESITPKTKAIISVDFGGKPVAVEKIRQIAKTHNLAFISDSSHSLGSSIDGVKVGNFADATIFSLHAIKPITTGEGGVLVCEDEAIYNKAKLIRSHGIEKRALWNSDMLDIGFNFRLSDINAALGISQLKKLDAFIAQRDVLARYYEERFANNSYFDTIPVPENMVSSRHLYPILLKSHLWCAKEEIFTDLQAKGIGVQVHYKPIYKFTPYVKLFGEMRLSTMEDFYKAELSIPLHQGMNLQDAEFVADTLFEVLKKHDKGFCS